MKKELKYKVGNHLVDEVGIRQMAYDHAKNYDSETRKAYIKELDKLFTEDRMGNKFQKITLPLIGILGLVVCLTIAYVTPYPSYFQSGVFWAILTLFAAAFAALIPGFLEIKFGGWLRAAGALGVLALMYLVKPVVMKEGDSSKIDKLSLFVVPADSSDSQIIAIDFNKNAGKVITEVATKGLSDYYGAIITPADFTCYRKSDGKIYVDEICRDIKEYDVLLISNEVVKKFKDKRQAYNHLVRLFEK